MELAKVKVARQEGKWVVCYEGKALIRDVKSKSKVSPS